MSWNPEVYNKFKTERYAPFYDLLQLIQVKPALKVIDLGCGTGELTGLLAKYLPGSEISGIDSSTEMLNSSAQFSKGRIRFELKTIQKQIKDGTKWDLIFSNAALQWIENHTQLFPEIISLMKAGGQLVIQVPSNHDHYTHVCLQELALETPFREALQGWTHISPVLTIGEYAQIYFDNGGRDIIVYEKVYPHILHDADGLLDWVSGTVMIRYMEKLPHELRTDFKNKYRNKLLDAFKGSPVFYPFKRILMKAVF